MRRPLALALLAVTTALAARAEDAPAAAKSPYGDTYTAAELAAMDRALRAGNLTREDLAFRKDMAKGIECLPVVREMLRDPLLIAPTMDRLAAATARGKTPDERLMAALGAAGYAFTSEATDGARFETGVADHTLRIDSPGAFEWVRHAPETPEAALDQLVARLDSAKSPFMNAAPSETLEAKALRRQLPDEMAMRTVFASPYDAATTAEIEALIKEKPQSWLHDEAVYAGVQGLLGWWCMALGRAIAGASSWPAEAFPKDKPVERTTPAGRIAIGTLGDDVYVGDYAAIVDPGGNDVYRNGRFASSIGLPGQRVGLLIDLGGNDTYDARDVDCTFGCAFFGIALLADLGQGNDRYFAGHGSLGAAVLGVGVLYDDGGSDVYEGKSYTQGAAAFGIGVLYDDALQAPPVQPSDEETKDPISIAAFDDDRLYAWVNAQALARPRGVALCINTRGNDHYEAGGVYLHAPLFSDRYQSFSQGFSIGSREIDHAGGIALLIDRAGNDRYLGDIYDQGVGYWYSAGLLWDGGGHDLYEMTQYGQGSGIHLAVGGLVDVAGSDAYVMHSGLGQGGSHDYAASILHDRGGNDRYDGNTSCNGTGLTNSVGIHVDRAGDDTYAARRDGGFNAGRPARGTGSIGLFVDLAGKDDYLQLGRDGQVWRSSDVGVGADEPDEATPTASGGTPAADQAAGKAEVPPVCRHEGPLDEKVFDELWAIACRWEVGDNRTIVPEARKRLVAFGKDVLPHMDRKMEKDDSGLELRAYVDVLQGLSKEGARADVVALLEKNLAGPTDRRRRVALYLVGELKAKELEATVVKFLKDPDDALRRRASGVLLALGSHAGDDVLRTWLASNDEREVLAAVGALLGLEADVYPSVRPLFDHPMVSVRARVATGLAEHGKAYGKDLLADLAAGKEPSPRALRTLLDALTRASVPPTAEAAERLARLVSDPDWAIRADAAHLARRWGSLEGADPKVVEPLVAALEKQRAEETEPFVKAAGEKPTPVPAK